MNPLVLEKQEKGQCKAVSVDAPVVPVLRLSESGTRYAMQQPCEAI